MFILTVPPSTTIFDTVKFDVEVNTVTYVQRDRHSEAQRKGKGQKAEAQTQRQEDGPGEGPQVSIDSATQLSSSVLAIMISSTLAGVGGGRKGGAAGTRVNFRAETEYEARPDGTRCGCRCDHDWAGSVQAVDADPVELGREGGTGTACT